MRHLAWMGGGKLISGFAQHWKRPKNPASKGDQTAESTHQLNLYWREFWGAIWVGGSLYGLWKVKSRYLVLSATWEAQPWLAGWQGPGAGAVNIQICPNPPANYWRSPPKKVWLTVGPLKSSTRLKKKIYCLNFTQYEQIAFHSRHWYCNIDVWVFFDFWSINGSESLLCCIWISSFSDESH